MIFTKGVSKSEDTDNGEDEGNQHELLLIENRFNNNISIKNKKKSTKKLTNFCDPKFEKLIIDNIHYLNEIVQFMKNDYKAKRVK